MSDLVEWEYGGITFHVAASLSDAARDNACARLLSEFDSRRARLNQTVSKPLEVVVKVIPSESDERPLEGVSHGLESIPEVELYEAADLYESGYYRRRCRVCGEPIKRSGSVGRAPVNHKECRT